MSCLVVVKSGLAGRALNPAAVKSGLAGRPLIAGRFTGLLGRVTILGEKGSSDVKSGNSLER